MADSFISKLITELTAKTTAADTDLVPVADSNGNFFKMTWQKMKQLLLGTKDISGVGDGTVTGAISELNTNMKQGGIRLIPWGQVNSSTINFADYSSSLKIFWVNGWDSGLKGLTPTPNISDFWCVLHIPCYMNATPTSDDTSYIKQIWFGLSNNRLVTRSYWKTNGWSAFVEK